MNWSIRITCKITCKIIWGLVILVSLFSGCFSGGLQRRYPTPPQVPLALTPPLYDYAGCMHIHSIYSHDSRGTLDEILQAGKASGVDFLITTDHNSLGLLKYQGLQQGILLIAGVELSTSKGHLIALGLDKMPSQRRDVPKLLAELHKKNALAIVAHPVGKRGNWEGPKTGFMGMEIFNLSTAVKRTRLVDLILTLLVDYSLDRAGAVASLLQRPEGLDFYDQLSQKRRLVLLASVDAHAIPIGGGAIHIYDHLFPIVRLHVWAPKLTTKAILKALSRGHCYISFDILGDGTSFSYYGLIGGKKIVMMGDQIAFQKGIKLVAQAPEPGTFVLYRNGKPLIRQWGRKFTYVPKIPGVFRLEVLKGRRKTPWIYANPIWITN